MILVWRFSFSLPFQSLKPWAEVEISMSEFSNRRKLNRVTLNVKILRNRFWNNILNTHFQKLLKLWRCQYVCVVVFFFSNKRLMVTDISTVALDIRWQNKFPSLCHVYAKVDIEKFPSEFFRWLFSSNLRTENSTMAKLQLDARIILEQICQFSTIYKWQQISHNFAIMLFSTNKNQCLIKMHVKKFIGVHSILIVFVLLTLSSLRFCTHHYFFCFFLFIFVLN